VRPPPHPEHAVLVTGHRGGVDGHGNQHTSARPNDTFATHGLCCAIVNTCAVATPSCVNPTMPVVERVACELGHGHRERTSPGVAPPDCCTHPTGDHPPRVARARQARLRGRPREALRREPRHRNQGVRYARPRGRPVPPPATGHVRLPRYIHRRHGGGWLEICRAGVIRRGPGGAPAAGELRRPHHAGC